MRSIQFERFGDPAEVLTLKDVPTPEPGPGEVRVRMLASPINPSDLLYARGRYGVQPALPAKSGFEGVGVVDRAGPGLLGKFLVGRRVFVLNQAGGNWADYAIVPANRAIPAAKDMPDEQVAACFVNPGTALAINRYVFGIPKGEWLLQSAAGSALGRMIIKLAQHDGFKTINVVRRKEAVEELKGLGADAVVCTADGPIDEQVRALTDGRGVRFAIDPVGGSTGTEVFRSLADDGRMIVYGTMTAEPIQIDPRHLISGRRRLEGFYLGYFMEQLGIPRALLFFREIAGMIREGVLTTEFGTAYALEDIAQAVRQAEEPGRHGKVLLRIDCPGSDGDGAKGGA